MTKKRISKEAKRWKKAKKETMQFPQGMIDQISKRYGNDVVFQPTSGEKMSEIILQFARPLLEVTTDDESYRHAISLAVYVWNLSFLPVDQHDQAVDRLIKRLQIPTFNAQLFKKDIEKLIQRRITDFPDINRMVASYEVTNTESGHNLAVASMSLTAEEDT